MSDFELHFGDCVEIMAGMRAGSAQAVIADPPYMINTKSDGTGKINPWADRVNAALWYKVWLSRARSLIAGGGCCWSFLNWRSFVTFQKSADDLAWPIDSLMIWDKQWIGPGGQRGLRPSYEMVALWTEGDFAIEDRGLPDIQRFKWSSIKPSGHPAEKPADLIKWIIINSTNPGDTVIDPFMGSGTTGVAALQTGRRFVGIEIDPNYFDMATRRIEAAASQMSLFDAAV